MAVAALASFSARSISALPTPHRNGSTVSGPNSSAGVSPIQIGVKRTEPTSSEPMRAVNDSSSRCLPALADPVGAARIAAGTEGALMQVVDRQRVVGRLRQDGQGSSLMTSTIEPVPGLVSDIHVVIAR